MNIILKMKTGSHLFGLTTPTSDIDYKGIYLPTFKQLILQDVPKSINNISDKGRGVKNSAGDIDLEFYSLQYFLELAMYGNMSVLDMIHAPQGWEDTTSIYWEFIKQNRSKFYTKKLSMYIDYVQTQTTKYSIKGSRLLDADKVLTFLKNKEPFSKLSLYWDSFPEGDNIKKLEVENCRQGDKRAIEVCSRKLMADTKVGYAIECIENFYSNYGKRAQQARDNEGIDWKALSHAFRAIYQLKDLYTNGDITFPLKERDFIIKVKQGKLHYLNDGVGTRLDELSDEIQELAEKSSFPEKVDREFWENWLVTIYNSEGRNFQVA